MSETPKKSSNTPIFEALMKKAIQEWPRNLRVESVLVGMILTSTSLAMQKDMIARMSVLPELSIGVIPNIPMAIAGELAGLRVSGAV